MNFKQSLAGSIIAFFVATSCCWLPALIVGLGGATSLLAFSQELEKYSGVFMLIGVTLLGAGSYKYYKQQNKKMTDKKAILETEITCPECGYKKIETMPTDACQFFYECEKCKNVLKPRQGDCCVYCSYATVPCPPIQLNQNCC